MLDADLIVQARMESTRLPGKVLLPLAGKPLILHLLERLQTLPVRSLKIAVSEDPQSAILVKKLKSLGYVVVTGHPANVYQRFVTALEGTKSRAVIRVTADNPLTDADAIHKGTLKLIEEDLDYLWMENCPRGCGCDIFKTSSFLSFKDKTLTPDEKEHLVYLFRDKPEWKKAPYVCPFPPEASKLSYTIDTPEEYQEVDKLFKIHSASGQISLPDIIRDALTQKKNQGSPV